MDQQQPALFAGRYDVSEPQTAEVQAIDRQPWLRCWSCDSTLNEAGEMYCTQCGADLQNRSYVGQITSGEPQGLALIPSVDPALRDLLPEIWDQASDGDQVLTLLRSSGRPALVPPLDEIQAVQVGHGLARLLKGLHAAALCLGKLTPDDLELTPKRQPRLRTARALRRVAPEDAAAPAADLKSFAELLEALTATPRTTRRLDEQDIGATLAEAPLAGVLRDLRTGQIADAAALEARFADLLAGFAQPAPLWTQVGSASHEGMVRELDEDSLLTMELRMVRKATGRSWGLYVVADGMGGHSAGEVASDLAIRGAYEVVQEDYLTSTVDADQEDEEPKLRETVRKAILRANEKVLREARTRGNDMGTTITMALVAGNLAVIGNVGDSRTYLYRGGKLRRISKDHSLVMRLVDLGQISEEDIYSHPQRNAVLRSIGDKHEIEVDLFTERLQPGDALLLMSDGQWEMTRDPQMETILAANPDPQAACEALIKAANANGGDDNITAVFVKFYAIES